MRILLTLAIMAALANALYLSPTFIKLLRGKYTLEIESEYNG